MPSKYAKPAVSTPRPRSVVFVVYPNVKLLDLVGPLQVFNDALNSNGKPAYSPVVASIDGAPVQTDTCIPLECEPLRKWQRRSIDTLILVGGVGVFDAIKNRKLIDQVTRLSTRANRTASVCNGAFILATCGLLNKHRATTHWESTDKLASLFPDIKIEPDSIYVNDGPIWSSAGVTAGIDMALAMVGEDLGKSASLDLARSLVTYLIRPGGQSQFSQPLQLQASHSTERFDDLHSWVLSNLDKDLSVAVLAEKVNMSPRHFSREYSLQTGRPPGKAIAMIRVEAARRLLEDTNLSISAVARRCGFGDDERMRRAFVRVLKVPPSHFRKVFRQG